MSYIAERRLEEKERRRAEILDAAEAVVADVGWEAMTMDQVARNARLSRALLYVYFNDKTDLMHAINVRGLTMMRERFAAAVARPRSGAEKLEAIGRAYLAFSQEFPVYFEVVSRCELRSPDASKIEGNELHCMHCGDAVQQIMIETLQEGMRDGSIRADAGKPEVIAVVLWGYMHGVIQIATNKGNILAHKGVATGELLEQALLMAGRSLEPKA